MSPQSTSVGLIQNTSQPECLPASSLLKIRRLVLTASQVSTFGFDFSKFQICFRFWRWTEISEGNFPTRFPQCPLHGWPRKAMDVPPSSSTSEIRKRLISSYILVSEYGLLFLVAVAILLVVCLRSTSRLRTRLVYFYVITIIISLGTANLMDF